MRPLSADGLLTAWERGRGLPPVQQALLLLEAACPEESSEALAACSIGQRDSALLDLRQQMLGPGMECTANCPACGERLEFSLQVPELIAQAEPHPGGVLSTASGGFEVSFRLPNSLDLASLPASASAAQGARHLLRSCLLEARQQGAAKTVADLPEEVAEAIASAMEKAEPQANLTLRLACPACRHGWLSPFDIVTFFWAEIEAWAERLLYDVHTLASAYGWSESEILHLSAWRRQRYLDWVNQ